jgi:hypothetical protein
MAAVGLFSAIAAFGNPNLTPFTPGGWSSPVVVTTVSGSTTQSAGIVSTNPLYIDWAVGNSGTSESTTFEVYLFVDGVSNNSWTINGGLSSGAGVDVVGQPIGTLSPGTHTVSILADATMAVSGDDRLDDAYTNTFSVGAVILPAPTPQTPVDGSTNLPEVPFFSWSQVSGAASYRVLIATQPGDLPTNVAATTGGSSVVLDAVTPTNNFSPTIQLTPNTTYYWAVHANPGTVDDGVWSTVEVFKTGTVNTGLTIIPTFDSSITSDPNAATIEATIRAAISVYQYYFSNNVTASFEYTEMDSGLGFNSTYEIPESYSSYRSALVSHASTTDDSTALAHLPSSANNPVNNNSQVSLTLPLARALGYSGANPPAGQADSIIYLNTSIMNLSSATTDGTEYSLFATVSHEMDEALGLGSALNGLANGAAAPTGPVDPQDLFRYDQNGNRSFTTSLSATSFFSLDGTTDLAQFNQNQNGDFGDWYSINVTVPPQVQDAALAPGVNPVLNVELRVLDVIGYGRVSSPTNVVPQILLPTTAAGNFDFNLVGIAGSNYVVQASTNLLAWTNLSTNTIPAAGSIEITNATGSNPHKYFRAMQK